MAFIDYGSVVKKNGEIIQKDFFMDMKESVGFTLGKLEYKDWTNDEIIINGNFFSYMGDKDFLICIYKSQLVIISNNKIEEIIWYGTEKGDIILPYKKQSLHIEILGIKLHIKRLYNNNRFKLRFWYKGDLYECIYGYGVDIDKNIWYDVKPNEQRFIDDWFSAEHIKAQNTSKE